MKTGSNSANEIGILYQQSDGRVTGCNKEAENILGYTALEMRSVVSPASFQENRHCLNNHPAIIFGSCRSFVTALATGEPARDELEFQRTDGSQIQLMLDSQPLFSDSEERPSGVVTSFKNITAANGDRRRQAHPRCR